MKIVADPVALLWFGLSLACCVLFARRRWRLAWVCLATVLVSCAMEAVGLPWRLLRGLEQPYVREQSAQVEPAGAVVVLGGYVHSCSNNFLGLGFNESSDRIITGIALVREGRGRVLVLGGGGRESPPEVAEPLEVLGVRDWIHAWNLTTVPVEILGRCVDTHDEALRNVDLARKNGWNRIILVTSAWHMKRSVATFRKAGMEVIPVGCGFQASHAGSGPRHLALVPRTRSLVLYNLWLEETLGYLYYWARGWV